MRMAMGNELWAVSNEQRAHSPQPTADSSWLTPDTF